MTALESVATVRGPVALSELGSPLAHEHIEVSGSEFARFHPELAWAGDRATIAR